MNFIYSDTEKRYHTYDYELKHRYGTKCAKIPLDAGFSCPNRECGGSGCIYCSPRGSGDFCSSLPSVEEQFAAEYERLSAKWGKRLPAIPYFQAYTNTYAPPEVLSDLFHRAAELRDASGQRVRIAELAIATRPDCLSDGVMQVLSHVRETVPVTVELGLQSAKPETLLRIRRGHTVEQFLDGYRRLTDAGIPVCVHIINGFPWESTDDMLDTARFLAILRPYAVKIHMLHVTEGTVLGQMYRENPFPLLTAEEYIDTVCRQLELLPPKTVIERVTGDAPRNLLLAPLWTGNKRHSLNSLDRRMRESDTVQGRFFGNPAGNQRNVQ